MRNPLLISLAAILMLSCNKHIESHNSESGYYLNNIIAGLKDSLNDNDLANIDFSKAIITDTYDGRSYLMIPFNGKKFSEELVDFEYVEDLSPIDITKYLKSFSKIPRQLLLTKRFL